MASRDDQQVGSKGSSNSSDHRLERAQSAVAHPRRRSASRSGSRGRRGSRRHSSDRRSRSRSRERSYRRRRASSRSRSRTRSRSNERRTRTRHRSSENSKRRRDNDDRNSESRHRSRSHSPEERQRIRSKGAAASALPSRTSTLVKGGSAEVSLVASFAPLCPQQLTRFLSGQFHRPGRLLPNKSLLSRIMQNTAQSRDTLDVQDRQKANLKLKELEEKRWYTR